MIKISTIQEVKKMQWDNYKKSDEGFILWNEYYNKYIDELYLKAISMYEWKGLPKEIDYRFIEYILMSFGMGVFFYDDVLKEYVFTKVVYNGKFDIYHNMEERHAYAVNGYNVEVDEDNSILCFNTFLRRGILRDIEIYARELANIKMTIDVNREQQKTPLIVNCTQNQKLTFDNILQKIKGFAYHIMITKNTAKDFTPTILNTESPYLIDKLHQDFEKVYNQALTFIGVETGDDKRERLVAGEVLASQGDVETQRYVYLNARRQCAEKFNEMFEGFNVTVDFRSNITTVNTAITEEFEESIKEGEEDE